MLALGLLLCFLEPCNAELRFLWETPVASQHSIIQFDRERELIYCTDEHGILIVDFSDPWQPEIIGRCPTPGISEDFTFDRMLVFVTENSGILGQNSLNVINAENPQSPELVAWWEPPARDEDGRHGRAFDVVVQNDHLYLLHGWELPGQQDRRVSLSVFRPSRRGEPELLNTVELPASTQAFAIDNYLYLSAAFTMNLISIENPVEPEFFGTFIGMWRTLTRWQDYVVSAGPFNSVPFYNINNPEEPDLELFFDADTTVLNVSVNDNMVAVNRSTTLRLYGLWDFPDIELAFDGDEQEDPSLWEVNSIALCDQFLVTGGSTHGLSFFFLDDPYEPELYFQIPQPPKTDEVHLMENGILATLNEQDDVLGTWQIDRDGEIRLLSQLSIPDAENLSINNNFAFAIEWHGFRIIDLAEPAQPQLIFLWELDRGDERYLRSAAFSADGNTMYTVRSNRLLSMFDVSDPENPEFISDFYNAHTFQQIQVLGNRLFVSNANRFAFFDIENPRDPNLIVYTEMPCGHSAVVEGDYIYTARRTPFALRVIDISDIRNPQLLFDRNSDHRIYTNSLAIRDDMLIQFMEQWGMILWDISDPANPDSIGWIDTPGQAFDGCWIDDELIVADRYSLRKYADIEPPPQPDFALGIDQGWSLISSPVIPENGEIETVFESIVENGNLTLAKDDQGNFYLPDQFNNMPDWDVNQGYQVKLRQSDSLLFFGDIVPPDRPIPLRQGWSMASYFPEIEIEAREAFRNIENLLIIAKDGWGNFYSPEFNFNNIPPLHRGAGYQIKVEEEVELVYPPEGEENVIARSEATNKFDPIELSERLLHFVRKDGTGENMSVLITSVNGIEIGPVDQIRAFDCDGNLVGVGNVEADGRSGLAVWGDDLTTQKKDGLEAGEGFKLIYWDSKNDFEIQLEPDELICGNNLEFRADELVVLKTSAEGLVPETIVLKQNYPNPFNSVTKITFGLPEATEISLKVFDISGRIARTLATGEYKSGYYNFVWDAHLSASGIYFIKLQTKFEKHSIKVALVR